MNEDLKKQFCNILEDNKLRILRICRIYAKDSEDRKDLYQDVIFNIWKSLPSFREEAQMSSWIYRVGLNVCMRHSLNYQNKNKGRVDLQGITIIDKNADILENMDEQDNITKLYSCIEGLSESDKSLILLYLEDLPYKTISEITGSTENHIAVKLNRIKKKLMSCINN